jgi:hypothetical protein
MTVLRSRLLERKIAEENAKYAAHRKDQVGTGERSEKIRTYNFPQNRVTDHRIEVTLYNLSNFVNGELDELIDPLMTHEMEEKLKALEHLNETALRLLRFVARKFAGLHDCGARVGRSHCGARHRVWSMAARAWA